MTTRSWSTWAAELMTKASSGWHYKAPCCQGTLASAKHNTTAHSSDMCGSRACRGGGEGLAAWKQLPSTAELPLLPALLRPALLTDALIVCVCGPAPNLQRQNTASHIDRDPGPK